ncbi:hypothetical protein BGZ54_000203 [Gamsiella multidivaricata]|nr:hypothetical protein BGZ54_000203 [Gamsiella multidivaricata]
MLLHRTNHPRGLQGNAPALIHLSETLYNDLEKEEEPIVSETLEMIEKLQEVKLLQSQIRELRKVAPPSNTYQDVGNTRDSVETEDIKAERRYYLQ